MPPMRQQPVALWLDHRVALAAKLLELRPVYNRNLPTPITDYTGLL